MYQNTSIPVGLAWTMRPVCLAVAMATVLSGCQPEPAPTNDQIFVTPPAGHAFNANQGTVRLSALDGKTVCYTLDGNAAAVNDDGSCAAGVSVYAGEIALTCAGSGVEAKVVSLAFDWPSVGIQHRQASFSLNCDSTQPLDDTDNDGIADDFDNCPMGGNPDQADADDDGIGDVCDFDADNDGIDDANDNCPVNANADQLDSDDDGTGDACDTFTDSDRDGVADAADNCPLVANEDQADLNGNQIGDACEDIVDDRDVDNVPDHQDNCPDLPNSDQLDTDGDGIGNVCDSTPNGPDRDADTVPDATDNCPDDPNQNQADSDGDGIGNACDAVQPPVTVPGLHSSPISVSQQIDDCLQEATGRTDAANVKGAKLTSYLGCLSRNGMEYDPFNAHWVNKVRRHCYDNVNWMVGGIGHNHTAYLNCFTERGLTPSSITVNSDYSEQVIEHCWGDPVAAEEALGWLILLTTSFPPSASGSTVLNVINGIVYAVETIDTVMDIEQRYREKGGLQIVDIAPRALTNYPEYKQCLQERQIPGLVFEPFKTTPWKDYRGWTNIVDEYCLDTVVNGGIQAALGDGTGWTAEDLKQCYLVHEYPEHGAPMPSTGVDFIEWIYGDIDSVAEKTYDYAYSSCQQVWGHPREKTSQFMGCIRKIGATIPADQLSRFGGWVNESCAAQYPTNVRGDQANAYRNCIESTGFALTTAEETSLSSLITTHCDNSFYPSASGVGRFENYNPYWQCFTERGSSFPNNDTWKNGVYSYCAGSNGVNVSGYKLCIDQRDVDYDDNRWKSHVKNHCDSVPYPGGPSAGRFQDYNAYWNCFKAAGTTFINDATWQNGVRDYCAKSNGVNVSGYKTCLSQRSVSYVESTWKSHVKSHCDSASYPGGPTGGRFEAYNTYWNCFKNAGTTYINDSGWKTGVRNFCAKVNVGGGSNAYKNYNDCISARQVDYAKSSWCSAVETHCEAQWYPFGGKDVCYSERKC